MKVEDFAYKVVMRTIQLLEDTQHYKIPEETRKSIGEKIIADVGDMLREPS